MSKIVGDAATGFGTHIVSDSRLKNGDCGSEDSGIVDEDRVWHDIEWVEKIRDCGHDDWPSPQRNSSPFDHDDDDNDRFESRPEEVRKPLYKAED